MRRYTLAPTQQLVEAIVFTPHEDSVRQLVNELKKFGITDVDLQLSPTSKHVTAIYLPAIDATIRYNDALIIYPNGDIMVLQDYAVTGSSDWSPVDIQPTPDELTFTDNELSDLVDTLQYSSLPILDPRLDAFLVRSIHVEQLHRERGSRNGFKKKED